MLSGGVEASMERAASCFGRSFSGVERGVVAATERPTSMLRATAGARTGPTDHDDRDGVRAPRPVRTLAERSTTRRLVAEQLRRNTR